MTRIRSLFLAVLVLPSALRAQEGVARPAVDTASPPAVVTRRDLVTFALIAALAGVAYSVDAPARDWARSPAMQRSALAQGVADVGNPFGGIIAFSTGVALWGGGLLAKDRDVATTGFRVFEAMTIASTITSTLKGVAGRARPRALPHERDAFDLWRGIRGGGEYQSFPSGHTTAAFSFAATITSEVRHRAPRHALAVGTLTYGLALATAYARMHEDAHWLSDVTFAAAIGTVTGVAVSRYHRTRPTGTLDRWALRPVLERGAMGTRVGIALWR